MFVKHKKEHRRRGSNPILGLFRLVLSLFIFAVLVGGVYSAYKQFSGLDPLNLSPQSISTNFFSKQKLLDLALGLLSVDMQKKAQDLTGEVAGQSAKVIPADQPQKSVPKKPAVSFKFALVTDSHNDNDLLFKALTQAKDNGAKFAIGLGDYTDVGTITELANAKDKLDSAGLRYFVTSGDHDLWDSRNKNQPALTNFNKVFGIDYQSFDFQDAHFIILSNSDNYHGFGTEQLNWFNQEMDNVKRLRPKLVLAFTHEPLYHPSSDHFMGKVDNSLLPEAKQMVKDLKSVGVKEVFAGDIHYFTRYTEPETGISMTTVGAVTQQRNLEEPRFAMVTVYEDGSYLVEDVEIKQ